MGNVQPPSIHDGPNDEIQRNSHEVKLACTSIFKFAGVRAYHTSIIVDDREFSFGEDGMIISPPMWSHFAGSPSRPEAWKTEVIDCGSHPRGGTDLVNFLEPIFAKGSYDMLVKNCNSFTDAALYLLTQRRLDSRFSRLERWMLATHPVSTDVLNKLVSVLTRKADRELAPDPTACKERPGSSCLYVMNPKAEDFCLAEVLANLDVMLEYDDDCASAEHHHQEAAITKDIASSYRLQSSVGFLAGVPGNALLQQTAPCCSVGL